MTGTSQATAIAAAVMDDDLPEVKGSKLPPVAGRKKKGRPKYPWNVYIYICVYNILCIYNLLLSVIYPCDTIYIYVQRSYPDIKYSLEPQGTEL